MILREERIGRRHETGWGDASWDGQCQPVTVYCPEHARVSALLGPDGEPLKVPYPRHALGFDLRPRKDRT